VEPILWFTLYELAGLGACTRAIRVSTSYLAEKVGCSQQTASRHLIRLEREGLVERSVSAGGSLIRITDSGAAGLRRVYSGLQSALEGAVPPSVVLEGELFTGIGEGAYYVTRGGYREQFREKLGFDPYPGTLNLRLTTEYDRRARAELERYPAIEITGFRDESRTFGPARCYRVLINNREEGAIVLAMRSHYNASVLEIIAPHHLRGRLGLKDGHKVRVEVLTSKTR